MKTLFIDIGNSNIKAAEKNGPEWEICFMDTIDSEAGFYSWFEKSGYQSVVVCSVVKRISQTLRQKYSEQGLQIIDDRVIPDGLMDYHTPHTLGVDRFLACYGAAQLSDKNVVVIDSGSACTVDLMTADGVYRGGVIMPGLELLRELMSERLPALPETDYSLPKTWPGKTSTDSILWGTTGMFAEAIRAFLHKYDSMYGSCDLYLTGGGAKILAGFLEKDSGFTERPYLVFEGMESFKADYLPV